MYFKKRKNCSRWIVANIALINWWPLELGERYSVLTIFFVNTKHRTEHRVLSCSTASTAPGTEILKTQHRTPHQALTGAHRCAPVQCESKHWRGKLSKSRIWNLGIPNLRIETGREDGLKNWRIKRIRKSESGNRENWKPDAGSDGSFRCLIFRSDDSMGM